jgi:arylsulfatase A-like enzyme
MSPLANMAVLASVGLAVFAVVVHLSRPRAVRVTFVVFASVFFLNVLVLESGFLSKIHFAAKVILSIGLAVALQRLIARRTQAFERFVRRTTIGLVLLVLILITAVGGRQYFRERRIIATLPDAPPSAPNVLLIVWDTVRAESMSLYGYERPTTPYLEDIAKEGTVFRNAIATASWTLPSHASFFTGRFNYELGTSWATPLDATYPTLAEVLTSHGYVTGGIVANTLYCCTERGLARGFGHYEDWVASPGELVSSSALIRFAFDHPWVHRLLGYYELLDRKPASRITNDFLKWVDRVPTGRPFFAFLNYFDAHQPYLPPADFARRFGPTDQFIPYLVRYMFRTRPCLPSNTTAEEVESIRNAYDGTLAYLDYDLKRLFGELRQRSLLDRTLVILVSDHGEEFGEHSTFGHGQDLHIQSIHVPLILRLPGIVPADVTVQESVTLRDIPATVIRLLNLGNDGLFPGQSLGRYWLESGRKGSECMDPLLSELNKCNWPAAAPAAKGPMRSVVTGNMHYIRNGDGTEEVYDLRLDPLEHNDLVQMQQGAEVAAQARCILDQMQ